MTENQVSVLDRPVYGLSEVAALLGLSWSRARAWLDGYERNGVRYPPVVRSASTGDSVVSWGEFVELGYLREYRRKGMPLQRLRPVIEALREEFNSPYPLATAKPFVGGKELVMKLQEDSSIPQQIAIVVRSGQTVMLSREAERFLKKVSFDPPDDGDVGGLHRWLRMIGHDGRSHHKQPSGGGSYYGGKAEF